MQKNCIKGDSIGHGKTGHPQGFPVAAISCQVAYLLCHGNTGATPISSVRHTQRWYQIHRDDITVAIRAIIRAIFSADVTSIGFMEAEISVSSFWSGGSMVLLTTMLEPETTRLVGMWWSNTMLRYLHMIPKSFTEGFSIKIYQHWINVIISPIHTSN